jgi:anti-sigma factor RsiW
MGELSCQRFVDLLGDYVEDVLSPDERRTMDAHCLACPQCRQLLSDYRRLPEMLRRTTDAAMSPPARARLGRVLLQARLKRTEGDS